MRHSVRWIIGGIAVVVVAAAGFAAWYVLGDDAPAKATLAGDCPGSGPASPSGTWNVAPGDGVYVGYRMTEVFAGDVLHKTAVGRTPTVDGTLTIANNKITAATVNADLRQLRSDRGARDNYIHTHGIESDTFPTATFKLTQPIALANSVPKGEKVKLTGTGTLTLHNVTKTVTVPLDACWSGSKIQVVGSAPVVLADYKIDPPNTGVVKVDDHGSLELALTFIPAA